MNSRKHIMIVAGEVSGDIHAADLVREIKRLHPSISFSGLGGRHLQEEGVELYADLTELAVIGFVEVLRHFKKIKKLFHLFLKKAATIKPDAVILVDYPGFNLRLAKELKKRNIKVIYYVSPQVWAWKEKRVKLIKRVTDRMIVFFKFEEDFYAKHGLHADFVGHPLIDHIKVTSSRHNMLADQGLPENAPTLGIIPGSRLREIKTLLPLMINAAEIILEKKPNVQFVLTKSKNIDPIFINKHFRGKKLPIAIIDNEFHNCINACDICMVASGTATLETALLERPMVIIYKTAWLTHLLIRAFIRIPWIGLPNIIAQKEIVPECIQEHATGRTIADKVLSLLDNPFRLETTINALKDVRKTLGEPGAASRAAKIIISEIAHRSFPSA